MLINQTIYHIAGFFEEHSFHEFHKLIPIRENVILEIFTLGINIKVALFQCFKVDKHRKEDNSLDNSNTNSNAILPS